MINDNFTDWTDGFLGVLAAYSAQALGPFANYSNRHVKLCSQSSWEGGELGKVRRRNLLNLGWKWLEMMEMGFLSLFPGPNKLGQLLEGRFGGFASKKSLWMEWILTKSTYPMEIWDNVGHLGPDWPCWLLMKVAWVTRWECGYTSESCWVVFSHRGT